MEVVRPLYRHCGSVDHEVGSIVRRVVWADCRIGANRHSRVDIPDKVVANYIQSRQLNAQVRNRARGEECILYMGNGRAINGIPVTVVAHAIPFGFVELC